MSVEVEALTALLAGRRIVALTGAGCSTDSGIPDYRGGGRTGPRNPIQHDAFMRRPDVRRRYWARATIGWERFKGARPNAAHAALADLESSGVLAGVITQNVDRLHHQAGSRRIVELHGALADVRCLGCGAPEARTDLQGRLLAANPDWLPRALLELQGDGGVRPDGDAELSAETVALFQVADCLSCGGALKPDVVFFGGTVAEPTLTAAWSLLADGEALLVVGSSLTVYSGFRFVRRAHELGMPIGIVNVGPTRGDALAQARVSAPVGWVLPQLEAALSAAPPAAPRA
ncbi:MAG TPA: NAD-dependent protein deacetylase [Polyangia bacterium]|nr:NAD-dependent protein deacetylase [Polyangia bacterium]